MPPSKRLSPAKGTKRREFLLAAFSPDGASVKDFPSAGNYVASIDRDYGYTFRSTYGTWYLMGKDYGYGKHRDLRTRRYGMNSQTEFLG
jgi:hypothetical protein